MTTREEAMALARVAGFGALTPYGEDCVIELIDLAKRQENERICAAIKAEDDHCWTGDYMLDSDDCIAVARGEWLRPEYATSERG